MMAAFAVTALVAGCSQNEITDLSPEANPAVGFGVYTGVQTRGQIMNDTWLQKAVGENGGGFGVLAYYTGQSAWSTYKTSATPNFMYNQKVTYSGGWTYAPLKYWPNTKDDKISFFAYAPYDAPANFPSGTVTVVDNGIELTTKTAVNFPTLTFTMKDVANKMVDLVTEQKLDVIKTTDAVAFTFDHVLSRAKFQARLDKTVDSKTHIIVTGARILGTAARTATNTGNNVTKNDASRFYKVAKYKYETETWDYTGATAWPSEYNLASVMNLNSVSVGSTTYTKSQAIEVTGSTSTTELFKTTTAEYLFLIPPYDDASEANQGIKAATDVRVQLDYDIVTEDDALDGKHSVTSTTATVSLPNGTLKRKKAYVYIFTIGLEAVTVSATVSNWDETPGNVYIPSTTVATADATGIQTAIGTMDTAKGNNPNCNYFVIDIAGALSGNLTINPTAPANFVKGDRIELNFKSVSGGSRTITLGSNLSSTWTIEGTSSLSAAGKITLKKK